MVSVITNSKNFESKSAKNFKKKVPQVLKKPSNPGNPLEIYTGPCALVKFRWVTTV